MKVLGMSNDANLGSNMSGYHKLMQKTGPKNVSGSQSYSKFKIWQKNQQFSVRSVFYKFSNMFFRYFVIW